MKSPWVLPQMRESVVASCGVHQFGHEWTFDRRSAEIGTPPNKKGDG